MLTKADILFGKIAINAGMVTSDQVEDCVRQQQEMTEKKPLGMILIDKGFITEEQLTKIIEIQRKNLQERAIHSREKRDDGLFGKLVMRFSFATEEQINECIRIQAKLETDLFLRLGEIMVKKGYLTNDQVRQILDFQRTKILTCPSCNTQYNVIMFTPGTKIRCYKCDSELAVPERLTTVAAEDLPQPTDGADPGRCAP